jgi:hypothetical protein
MIRVRLGDLRTFINENLPPVKKIPPGVHGPEYLARREKIRKGSSNSNGTMYDTMPSYMRSRLYSTHGLGDIGHDESEETGRVPDGSTLNDIAREMGISTTRAFQLVNQALGRAKKFASMSDDNLDDFLDHAVDVYVDELTMSGEISVEEIEFMKNNPDAVKELDGFREFLAGTGRLS